MLIIPELRVLVLTKRHVGSENEIARTSVVGVVGHTAVKRGTRAQFLPKLSLDKVLKSSQLVIFSHSTIFITFSYRSLAGFLFKLLRSSRRRKPEVALDFCV